MLGSFACGTAVPMVEAAAAERRAALERDVGVCRALVEKYEAHRVELDEADQDFEQVCGALWLVENALTRLHEEQSHVLDAIRLRALSVAMHTATDRRALLAHRRWLRELGAAERAFHELRQRKLGLLDLDEYEVQLHLQARTKPAGGDLAGGAGGGRAGAGGAGGAGGGGTPSGGLAEEWQLEGVLSDDALLKALTTDLQVWGRVPSFREDADMRVERLEKGRRAGSVRPMQPRRRT